MKSLTKPSLKGRITLSLLSRIKSFLIRYKIIINPRTDIVEYLFLNVKRPFTLWLYSFIITTFAYASLLALAFWCFNMPPIKALPTSVGLAILWWVIVEFKKDLWRKE